MCNRKVRTAGYESSVIKERCTVELAKKIIRAAFALATSPPPMTSASECRFSAVPEATSGERIKSNAPDSARKKMPRCGTKTIYKVVKPVVTAKYENKF